MDSSSCVIVEIPLLSKRTSFFIDLLTTRKKSLQRSLVSRQHSWSVNPLLINLCCISSDASIVGTSTTLNRAMAKMGM